MPVHMKTGIVLSDRFRIDNVTLKKFALRQEMVGYDDIHSQCFKDTVTAYQKVRQDGQLHIQAFIAALEVYKRHEGEAEDASRQVQEYIAFAASLDPKKYWSGVYNERWITNR